MQLLLMHRKDMHNEQGVANSQTQPASKVERPTRPTVKPGMSETNWSFFLSEWGRYTRQTGITDAVLRDELWSCMEPELRELAFHQGFVANTEAELLTRIKDLAVTVLHPSVHLVNLHRGMQQQEGESGKLFAARVTGTAKVFTG